MEEIVLRGGHRAAPVRVGSTVRRARTAYSASIDSLLTHLHAAGWASCPKPLGYDTDDRQMLSFVEGDAASGCPLPAHVWSIDSLRGLGRLLRSLHDATCSFVPAGDAAWQRFPGAPVGDVMCHNDLGPWNTVFRGLRPHALIDWDSAAPGTREWDLACAAWHWVPLWEDSRSVEHGFTDFDARPSRLRALCEAYGGQFDQTLIDVVIDRQHAWVRYLKESAAAGDAVSGSLLAAGSAEGVIADIAVVERLRSQLASALA